MNKNYCMKALLAGLVLVAPAVWAQGDAPKAGAQDKKAAFSAERGEIKSLNDQERTELKAVNTGAQTPEQKRDARKAVREKYKTQRMALRKKYHGDAKPSAQIRQDHRKVRRMTTKQKPAEPAPAPAK